MSERRSPKEAVLERVEALKRKEEKIAQTKADLERRLKAIEQKDRKKETRLKILMGSLVMELIQRKVSWFPTARFHSELTQWLTRANDKALYVLWAHDHGVEKVEVEEETKQSEAHSSQPHPIQAKRQE